MTLRERLMGCAEPVTESGCWLWTGSLNGLSAYGRFDRRLAHRVSYEAFVGPIPEGLCVCHLCDVRCCINPAHLWLGTNQDNVNDRTRKGRGHKLRGETHGRSKLTAAQVAEIRRIYVKRSPEFGMHALGRRYGVTNGAIGFIIHGATWK